MNWKKKKKARELWKKLIHTSSETHSVQWQEALEKTASLMILNTISYKCGKIVTMNKCWSYLQSAMIGWKCFFSLVNPCYNSSLFWFFQRSSKFYLGLLRLQLSFLPFNSHTVFTKILITRILPVPSVTFKSILFNKSHCSVKFTLCFQGFVVRSGWV